MKDYTTDTPEFSDRIKILDTTDPGHADNVNVTTKQLLQNTLVNDRKLSEFAEVTDEDVENIINGPSGDVPEKKTPLTNLVNLIWTKWITPIKEGLAKKVDTSKIVKSTNITEYGFLMDGKTAAEEFAELNRKLEPSDITSEFTGFPEGIVLTHAIRVGNIVFLRLIVEANKLIGSNTINIPSKYASTVEQFLVEYHNSQHRKVVGYVEGHYIVVHILSNSETSYLSVSYPIATA